LGGWKWGVFFGRFLSLGVFIVSVFEEFVKLVCVKLKLVRKEFFKDARNGVMRRESYSLSKFAIRAFIGAHMSQPILDNV